MFLAGVLGSIRMNSSYEIFGRVVARQDLPDSLGLAVIWIGMMLVFAIDFLASLRVISVALQKHAECIACLALTFLPDEHCLSHRFRLLYIRCQARMYARQEEN